MSVSSSSNKRSSIGLGMRALGLASPIEKHGPFPIVDWTDSDEYPIADDDTKSVESNDKKSESNETISTSSDIAGKENDVQVKDLMKIVSAQRREIKNLKSQVLSLSNENKSLKKKVKRSKRSLKSNTVFGEIRGPVDAALVRRITDPVANQCEEEDKPGVIAYKRKSKSKKKSKNKKRRSKSNRSEVYRSDGT